jgi:homoserine kinase
MGDGWRSVRVPASSANLGPGFDALGLALGIYLECRFRPAAALSIRATGCDAESISTGEDNLIWQTAAKCGAAGSIELLIDNGVPIGKGLGSSAAAVVAGVVIGAELAGCSWSRGRVLEEAARIEGHPDNVGACVLGGIVASAFDSGGVARAVRLEMYRDYRVAVVVPDFRLPTRESRRVLPESYSHADAVFNLQHSALLLAALITGATHAFPAAFEDRVHQPYRFALVPGLDQVTKLRAPGLLGCTLSGAGPSILVFFEQGHEGVCEMVQTVFAEHGHASEVLLTEIATGGYVLAAD